MMLFGEKYPDPVRMISMGEFSRELCGGTHVANTREIGLLEIVAEEGVSAGTRRIEVLTGEKARELREFVQATTVSLASQLGTNAGGLANAVAELVREVKDLRKQLESGKAPGPRTAAGRNEGAVDYVAQRNQLREIARGLNVPLREVAEKIGGLVREREQLQQQIAASATQTGPSADELIGNAEHLANNVRLIVQELPPISPTMLRQLVDEIRSKAKPVAVFFATANGPDKVQLVAGVSADLIQQGVSAGQWVKEVAPLVGGGGGGKPDFAQAGGKQPENIRPALRAAIDFLKSSLQV
jgi:alanyl-tRNA synthetase